MPDIILEIGVYSVALDNIKRLGRKHRSTLGFLPDGAFEDYARKGSVLGIVGDGDICKAYLIYRVSRERAIIVHLCVDPAYRGIGHAKELVSFLSSRTKGLRGIGLNCRQDFPANGMWQRLGFEPRTERKGRSKSGALLTGWWLDHGLPSLWTAAHYDNEGETPVVMDANIFYDLIAQELPKSEESMALEADWLASHIELCLTGEIHNEINRDLDGNRRKRASSRVSNYRMVEANSSQVEKLVKDLLPIFPPKMSDSDWSDIRQISKTIASGISFFITRDTSLLQKSGYLLETHGLQTLRPADFVAQLDELMRDVQYQPRQLAATGIQIRKIRSGEQRRVAELCRNFEGNEKHFDMVSQLNMLMSSPNRFECNVVVDQNDGLIAVIGTDRTENGIVKVSLLRLARHPLALTVARYILSVVIRQTSREGRHVIKITDQNLQLDVKVALQDRTFAQTSADWTKLTISDQGSVDYLRDKIQSVAGKFNLDGEYAGRLVTALSDPGIYSNPSAIDEIECALWPTKVLDVATANYIVPIKPAWAEQLFDEDLAVQTLFPANERLALNHESIYYRSPHQNIFKIPGRILWYVSKDKAYEKTMAIRACSRLDEVHIGPASEVFKKYNRLGVYEWSHIQKIAKGSPTGQVMAIKFSNTVQFQQSVGWDEAMSVLNRNAVRSQFQSPCSIPSEVFHDIYCLGMAGQ